MSDTKTTSSQTTGTKIVTARGSIGRESLGFGVGEIVSMGTSLGVVAVLDKVLPKSIIDSAVSTVSKVVVEPHLDTIEKALSKCKLEECKVDYTKSREERAQRIAKGITVFGAAWALALGTKVWTRRWVDNKLNGVEKQSNVQTSKWQKFVDKFKMSRDEAILFAADEGAHIGSFIVLNTKGAEFTQDQIDTTSKLLEKVGIGKQKSKEISSMFWVWEVPNAAGMAAGLGTIYGKHAYGWPNQHKHQSISKIIDGTAHSLSNIPTK